MTTEELRDEIADVLSAADSWADEEDKDAAWQEACRVMRAAPELLEACKAVREYIQGENVDYLACVDAALAKAGGTP